MIKSNFLPILYFQIQKTFLIAIVFQNKRALSSWELTVGMKDSQELAFHLSFQLPFFGYLSCKVVLNLRPVRNCSL